MGWRGMTNVTRCTQELTEAICNFEAYVEYEKAKEKMRENPELLARLNAYRREKYEIQNAENGVDAYDELERFAKEHEEFRRNPLVEEYLSTELEMCRMIQRINQAVTGVVQLEIEEFADVIE